MIYIKKIIKQDLERTPTFSVESIRDFFKIILNNGESVLKRIVFIPGNLEFEIKFQKRETRDEYRVFLNELFNKINPKEGDILILRKSTHEIFSCEHLNNNHSSYKHLNYLFEERNNHQLIVNNSEEKIDKNLNQKINLIDEFITWFIKLEGKKHNYFTDSFSKSTEKLKTELNNYDEIYENQFKTKLFTVNKNELNNKIEEIQLNLEKKEGQFFEFSAKKSNHMPRAILGKNNYLKFLSEIKSKLSHSPTDFNINRFYKKTKEAGLIFTNQLVERFVASVTTKPFLICSGLTGSGKTKLAHSFVKWICESEKQYKLIPVGSDWTNREPLLGYPNGIDPLYYITPDSGALQLIIEALKDENQFKPYFLILDEMNLSHVERYFADFLSIMESGDSIKLYSGNDRTDYGGNTILKEILWPKNLFIIGTVNIDETTYMFSPKVLDRANVIEFRITPDDMNNFLMVRNELNMNYLFLDQDINSGGDGQYMAESFMTIAKEKTVIKIPELEGENNILNKFFSELQLIGSEFGYRTASEIEILITKLGIVGFLNTEDQFIANNSKVDIAIMQKLLPKLHGSRSKLSKVLPKLGKLCLMSDNNEQDAITIFNQYKDGNDILAQKRQEIIYPISFEKLCRMYKNAEENGFASFAEA